MEKRKFLQHSTFLMFSKIVAYVAVFITGVLLTRSLSKADYGTFSQVILLGMTLSLILGVWLAKSVYYFVPTRKEKREIVMQTTLVLFILGIVVGLLIWLLRGQIASWFGNPSLAPLAIYISLYMLMLTLYQLSESFFISVEKAHVLALANVVFSLVYLAVLSCALSRGASLHQLLTLIILLYLGLVIFILANMIRVPGIGRKLFIGEVLGQQFRYAMPLFFSSFVIVVARFLDKFIIAAVYPTTDFAIYFRGALELPVVMIITYTISNMLLPRWVQLHQADRKEEFIQIWHEAVKKTAILVFPLFVLFLFISQQLITFLYTERYAGSVPIFRIYLLTLLIQITAYDCVLQATGKTREILYASILNVICNLTVSLILIRLVGLAGAAIGLVCGQIISTLYYLARIRRIFRLSFGRIFPWLHILQVFGLAICLGAVAYGIHYLKLFESDLLFMGMYGLLFLALYALFIFKLRFLSRENLGFLKLSLFSRNE